MTIFINKTNLCVILKFDESVLSKSELSAKIGERIKQIRTEKGISQAELSRRCLKDKQHIELIENNKVSANVYTLYLIATALDVTLSTLLQINEA